MKHMNSMNEVGSIMIVVPHEDDELLLAAGIIYQAIKNHQKVTVVMATNGDCGCTDYSIGSSRLRETLEGLHVLGLPEQNIVFLGYADTGMEEADSFLMSLYNSKEVEVLKSHCSTTTYGLKNKPDFHSDYYGVSADYTRNNFYQDLKQVITEYKPNSIFTTSEFDMHGDHKALYLFLIDILRDLRNEIEYNPSLYSGIVHSTAGDDHWPLQLEEIEKFNCPNDLENDTNYIWEDRLSYLVPTCMMHKNRKDNLKYQAIAKHKTALKPDAIDYLYSFVKADEIFWKINW